MPPQLTSFAVLFLALYLISGTICLYVTILGWRHRNIPLSWPFTLMMGSLTIYIYAYILEVLSPDLETSLIFNNIEVPCMLIIPVAFLLIVMYSTGGEQYVTPRTLPLFVLGVIVLSLLEFTNPLHYLYYSGFSSFEYEGLVFWIHEHGPFFWLTIVYTYGLSLAALILIISHQSVTGACNRRSLRLLFIAAIIPIVINIICTFWITPATGIDLTPLSFLVPGLILSFGLFRYLFSTVPVAYTRVLSTMQDGVIITDSSSRVIDLNPAAEEITEVRLRDAVRRPIGDLVPALNTCASETCIPEEGTRAECMIPQYDGQPRYYDVNAIPLGTRGNESGGTLYVLRDISGRKQSELALFEANRKIALLSGITRHDIRNQLMALKAYFQLSEEALDNPAELSEYLAQQQKIADTIDRQIAFTQYYESLGANPPTWQDIGACIQRAVEGLSLGNVHIETEVGRLEVFADMLLEKVFYNLADNALRYGGDHLTTIRVTTRTEGSSLVLVFEDDGSGVAAEDKPRLFTKGFGKNTGHGLFLSREILSLSGIAIAENGVQGKGARFEILIPPDKFRFGNDPR